MYFDRYDRNGGTDPNIGASVFVSCRIEWNGRAWIYGLAGSFLGQSPIAGKLKRSTRSQRIPDE
jgi:hypothetical protein